MHQVAFLPLALVAALPLASAGAQDRLAAPAPSAPVAGASFRLPGAGERPLIDRLQDGTIWVGAETYKAGFDRSGARFVPFLGSQAQRNWPAAFRGKRVTLGGKALPCLDVAPQLVGDAVEFARGGMIERYVLRGDGLEQTFGFETLSERAEIVVTVGVETDHEVMPFGDGHRFSCPDGSFEYGRATAIDAAGRQLALTTRWTGQGFEISVPASFVAEASLPLWIDPLVYTTYFFANSPRELRTPDIAWDTSAGHGTICWERVFSATDRDVFVGICDGAMSPVGGVLTVDFSTDDWRKPRIAGNEIADQALVVAEVVPVGSSASLVRGRTVTGFANPVVGAAFLIANNAGNPDVGGVRELTAAAPYLVAYEYHFSATDHDIYGQRVNTDGTLAGGSISIDVSSGFEERPEISKSCGNGSANSAAWGIAYRRRTAQDSGEIRVAYYGPVSGLRSINGQSSVSAQSQVPLGDLTWAISSPTDEALGRQHLVAMQKPGVGSSLELRYILLSSTGGAQAATTSHRTYDYGRLDVDSDGCRFALAYEKLDHSTAVPLGAEIITLAQVGQSMDVQDLVELPNPLNQHRAPRLAARVDNAAAYYGVVWAELPSAGSWRVSMRTYSGVQDGSILGTRATACGTPQATGSILLRPYLGGYITLQANQPSNGAVGWFVGLPATTALPFCPGCTLGTDLMLVLSGPVHTVDVPCDGRFVGGTLAFQSFLITLPAPGLCLGNIALGDTADITIR